MADDRSIHSGDYGHSGHYGNSGQVLSFEVLHALRAPVRRLRQEENGVVGPWTYRAKIARGTLQLKSIEYRILKFLAARPYRAFTRRRIAAAVSTEREPVTAETLGRYIASLRSQLGFYGDYIQAVPYVGYRFKA